MNSFLTRRANFVEPLEQFYVDEQFLDMQIILNHLNIFLIRRTILDRRLILNNMSISNPVNNFLSMNYSLFWTTWTVFRWWTFFGFANYLEPFEKISDEQFFNRWILLNNLIFFNPVRNFWSANYFEPRESNFLWENYFEPLNIFLICSIGELFLTTWLI
jgi:hypothetical protein